LDVGMPGAGPNTLRVRYVNANWSAGDNAAMESFFSLLQKNDLDRQTWDTATSSGSRSSPGSNAPTTADDGKPLSADRPPSNTNSSLTQTADQAA
jgi:hypothetical protein